MNEQDQRLMIENLRRKIAEGVTIVPSGPFDPETVTVTINGTDVSMPRQAALAMLRQWEIELDRASRGRPRPPRP